MEFCVVTGCNNRVVCRTGNSVIANFPVLSQVAKLLAMLWLCVLFTGCAQRTTVHVYGKYLSEDSTQALGQALEERDFDVAFNDFYFPTSITGNTIMYSMLLADPDSLEEIADISSALGFPVERKQGMTEGNHWYTKNAVALFLFPAGGNNNVLFKEDLDNSYRASDDKACPSAFTLHLDSNGDYRFTGLEVEKHLQQELSGTWLYRQSPYIELRARNSAYSTQYFEVSRRQTQDKISTIQMLELTPLSSNLVPQDCRLEHGLRL